MIISTTVPRQHHGRAFIAKRFLFMALPLGAAILGFPLNSRALPPGFDYQGDTQRVSAEVSLTFHAGRYHSQSLPNNEELLQMDDFGLTSSPGDPQLPYKTYDILLPPNVDWPSLKLEAVIQESEALPGKHVLKAAPPVRPVADAADGAPNWGLGKLIQNNRNLKVYGLDRNFPSEPVSILAQSQLRKWRFARLGFIPVQYNPVTGSVTLIKSVQVKLSFNRIGTRIFRTEPLLRDRVMDEEAKSRFLNFNQAQEWYQPAPLPAGGAGPVVDTADYVIITTNAIQAGSTRLSDFVNHKIAEGHTVRVVTETDYGALAGQAPNGTAERIRQWLIDNYIPMGIKWVLLVGNPHPTTGDVPMKMFWPRWSYQNYRESPSDFFFANLTGNWDLDGDGFFGEDASSTAATTPDPAIAPETYSIRWTGQIEAAVDGVYLFSTFSDDGVRVQIDGTDVINHWTDHAPTANYGTATLTAGMHNLQVEYYNHSHDAVVCLSWREPGATSYSAVPSPKLFHSVGGAYVVGGLDGSYFNNMDFTAPALTRTDPEIRFTWEAGDRGPGGVDFTPDVYVGRIPVYGADYAALDHILEKTINYESATTIPAWRRNILFGVAYLWDPDSDWQLGESILADFGNALHFGHYRHYEDLTGAAPECSPVIGHPPAFPPHPPNPDPAAPDNMLKEWVLHTTHPGYGVVVWSTHGSTSGASGLMSSALCIHLDDNQPAFTFQGSCLNGYPDEANNLGYALLKQGAIATVSASRVSWNSCFVPPKNPTSGTNANLTYHYVQRVMNGDVAARALYRTKDDVSPGDSWMNKMDYNLYGDPTVALLKPWTVGNVDVIPVLDHSGSMSGTASATSPDRKIEVLKAAADQFVDLLDADTGNQFGLAKFSTTATTPMALQPFTAASRATAHATIAALTPTNLTSIGDGLNHAVTEFTTSGVAGNRRAVLLVTDGMENTAPMIADAQPSLVANHIGVYALGLGYSWGVDEARLVDLANATGGDYRITADDLLFRKYFIELLGSAADWSVITDPIATLAAGAKQTVPVPVCASDREVVFTTYWSGNDNAVTMTLQAPDGQVYTTSSPSYVGRKRYAFYRIDLNRVPNAQRQGTWQMNLEAARTGLSDNKVRLSASALAKTGTKMKVTLDKRVLYSGDQVLVQIRLANNGNPLTGATVSATYTKPAKAFGNIMNANKVTPAQLRVKTPEASALQPLQAKVAFLQRKLGPELVPLDRGEFRLYDDGTHGDIRAADGVYSASFAKTKVPGSYALRIRATNLAVGQVKTSREWTVCFVNRAGIAPQYSDVRLKLKSAARSGRTYTVTISPRDRFGNYMGPGANLAVQLAVPGATRTVVFTDQLNGAYTAEFFVNERELAARPDVEIAVGGKRFTTVRLPER